MLGLGPILNRVRFAARFRTLRRVAPDSEGHLHACGRSGVYRIPARCPHQGSPLVNAIVKGDEVVCHWHGCRFVMTEGAWKRAVPPQT